MSTYKIKEVNGKFHILEQKAPGKHYTIGVNPEYRIYTTLVDAEEHLEMLLKLKSMTDEEALNSLSDLF